MRRATYPSLALSLMAVLAFVYHLFSYTFSSMAYLLALALCVLLFVVSKPLCPAEGKVSQLLFCCAVWIALSLWRSQRLIGAVLDVLVLILCMLPVAFFARNLDDFRPVLRVVQLLSLLFAFGIFLQALTPSLYRGVLSLFPSAFAARIREIAAKSTTGFSVNPGFSAGALSCGILAALARRHGGRRARLLNTPLLLLFFAALLLTGKRGHVFFLVLAVLICYLVSVHGLRRLKRYGKIILFFLACIVLFVCFRGFLLRIPSVSRLVNSVVYLRRGEDVTSGRLRLYLWAIRLFLEHPLTGIGWGDFRTTVVGNATVVAELDTHNIYLQLLCETGIIGFTLMLALFLLFWNKTRRLYSRCLYSRAPELRALIPYLYFSFVYQTFFLLYGMSGNPLYDQNSQILYLLCWALTMSAQYQYRKRKQELQKYADWNSHLPFCPQPGRGSAVLRHEKGAGKKRS